MSEEHKELHDQLRIEEEIEHQRDDEPVVPFAGVVYGDTIYWVTIVAAVVTIAGQMLTFITQNNYLSPGFLLTSIWEGKGVDEIWAAVGGEPSGHWYMTQIAQGDGLTTAGLALGVFGVTPAIFAASAVLYKQGQKLFGSLAVVAGAITMLALTGLLSQWLNV